MSLKFLLSETNVQKNIQLPLALEIITLIIGLQIKDPNIIILYFYTFDYTEIVLILIVRNCCLNNNFYDLTIVYVKVVIHPDHIKRSLQTIGLSLILLQLVQFYWINSFRAVAVDRKKGESDGQTSDDDYEQFGGNKKSSNRSLH